MTTVDNQIKPSFVEPPYRLKPARCGHPLQVKPGMRVVRVGVQEVRGAGGVAALSAAVPPASDGTAILLTLSLHLY